MGMEDILPPEAVLTNLRANNKRSLLQQLCHHAAALVDLDEALVADVVLERERLGSTGFGNGVAIPHGKIRGLGRPIGVFATLQSPVAFDAVDQQPVDVLFLLLTPAAADGEHLKILACVSRTLRDRLLVEKLRGSTSAGAAYALLVGAGRSRAA